MADAANFTSFKLAHATPAHLHITSRSKFVGPIPKGWLMTHKKHWLKLRSNYHRRDLSFNADDGNLNLPTDLARSARWEAEAATNERIGDRGDPPLADSCEHSNPDLDPGSVFDETATPYHKAEMQISSAGASTVDPGDVKRAAPIQHDTLSQATTRSLQTSLMPDGPPDGRTAAGSLETSPRTSVTTRPSVSILPPHSGHSIRQPSSVSTASFATAPETLEEQAKLEGGLDQTPVFDEVEDSGGESSDNENGLSDTQSDASTIRIDRVTTQARLAESIIPKQPSQTATSSPGFSPAYNEMSAVHAAPSSSDENSRRSLLNHTKRGLASPILRPAPVSFRMSGLVRFRTETRHDDAVIAAEMDNPVCIEGAKLDKKTKDKARRQDQGYFNQRMLRNPFRKPKELGELLRAERMLVRMEFAREGTVPSDYSETKAPRIQRRTEMHWRELIVAARNSQNGNVILRFHRNRTIPAIAKEFTNTRASEKLELKPGITKVNLYSSLDKTIVLWERAKKGTRICILRPRTTHASIEWYAFLQTSLKIKPNSFAMISVPLLNLRLRIDLRGDHTPRGHAESDLSSTSSRGSSEDTTSETASVDINEEGQLVASGVAITGEYLIDTCWRMLAKEKMWSDVLDEWRESIRMGFCWRRYDRLEWIHGHNAQQLVGQWAMQASHDLELRPKEHYATEVKLPSGDKLCEPAPIEGFLVRLTSSAGRQARFGKVFYKRLYFSSHDNLLFYSNPAKASPPPPPAFACGQDDAEEVLASSPKIYDVDPYPLDENGCISWLNTSTSPEAAAARNRVAITESSRRVAQLQVSEGYIDLTQVIKVRRCMMSHEDVKNNIGHHSSDVPYHPAGAEDDEILAQETGAVDSFDDSRVFELVLRTGLVVRLQAFDEETRQAWMEHLQQLIRYWRWRLKAEASELRRMRQANLDVLSVDEEVEGLVGQYASKWEVSHCVSEPQVYNFCPLASCRTIALKGILYRKPRIHSTFKKYECVISHGQLLIFNHMYWDAGGTPTHRIHHSRRQVIDLKECYIYSGNVTEGELISARETSDREGPGRHSLPRLYDDGWTSQDEQETLCFVIWSGRRRQAYRGADKNDSNQNNSVSRLGVAGRSTIYMARCRQERDLWVQIIANEIERSVSA